MVVMYAESNNVISKYTHFFLLILRQRELGKIAGLNYPGIVHASRRLALTIGMAG